MADDNAPVTPPAAPAPPQPASATPAGVPEPPDWAKKVAATISPAIKKLTDAGDVTHEVIQNATNKFIEGLINSVPDETEESRAALRSQMPALFGLVGLPIQEAPPDAKPAVYTGAVPLPGETEDTPESAFSKLGGKKVGESPVNAEIMARHQKLQADMAAEKENFDQTVARMPPTEAPQGGHAGGGVASLEELSRPGRFVKASKSGALTDQGKTPDFNLRPGEVGYQVKPDGSIHVVDGVEQPVHNAAIQKYANEVYPKPKPEYVQTLAQRGQLPNQTVNLSPAYGDTGKYVGGLTSAEPQTVSDKMAETFGTTNDSYKTGFILSDGRKIPLQDTHNGMLDTLYKKYGDIGMDEAERTAFINNEQAVRTRFSTDKAGLTVHISVPAGGVTKEEIPAIQQAISEVGKNGNVVIERADVSPETKDSLTKTIEFPKPGQAEEYLKQVQAHPDQHVSANVETPTPAETPVQNATPPAKQGIPEGSKFVASSPEEYRAELDKSPRAGEFLQDSAEELRNHKTFKLQTPDGKDSGIAYSITPKGELRGVVNNGPYTGAAAQAIKHGFENGATHTEPAWDVNGRLANLYKDIGTGKGVSEPYDVATYGEPSKEMKAAWQKAGWKEGDPYPNFTRLDANKPAAAEVVPNKDLQASAQKYVKTKGLPEINHEPVPVDLERAKDIAKTYHEAIDAPNDPYVKESYDALKKETKDQFHHLRDDLGLKFAPQAEDPYTSAGEMMKDVKENNRLKVFTGSSTGPGHPLSEVDPETGQKYNTLFRWVHDAMGHAAGGNDFSEAGEKSATEAHAQMYSKLAQPAMRAETEGQTSWFFHNPEVEAGRAQPGEFAPQKATLIHDPTTAPSYVAPSKDAFFMFASPAEHAAGFKPGAWNQVEKSSLFHELGKSASKQDAGGIDPRTGKSDTTGKGVEVMPELRQPLDHKPTEADFQDFFTKHQELFAKNPELRVGWDNNSREPGGHEINVGAVGPDAARVAKKLDQYAAFDIAKGKDIPTGGAGLRKDFPNYSLEDRMKDLRGEPQSDIPGFEHLSKDVHDNLEPDEREYLQGNKTLQRNTMDKYHSIIPSVAETTNAMQAGAALSGWWKRYMDVFQDLAGEDQKSEYQPLSKADIQKWQPTAEQVANTIGPSHAEVLKQWHAALSANKFVEVANNLAWHTYADWLDAGKPTDRKSINDIGVKNGAMSDSFDRKGNVAHPGVDTDKLYGLVNSPEMKGERPFSGDVFRDDPKNPLMGPTKGARKVPSMGATVAGKGNLNRLVIDTHIRDFYGQKPQGSAPQYIADSAHLRQAAKGLGLKGGEGQEQLWGTVLGVKSLLKEGLTPEEASGKLNADVINRIGKDYAEVIANDPEISGPGGILDRLKDKYGIGRGSAGAGETNRAASGPGPSEGGQAGSQKTVDSTQLAKTAERIRGQISPSEIKTPAGQSETAESGDDTSFNFGANLKKLTKAIDQLKKPGKK